jgi:hypothetical protein
VAALRHPDAFDPYADAPGGAAFLAAAANLPAFGPELLEPRVGARYDANGAPIAIDPVAVQAALWPHPVFLVADLEQRTPWGDHERCTAATVVEALPAWVAFGPHGRRVVRFLDRLRELDSARIEALGLEAPYRLPFLIGDVPEHQARAEANADREVRYVVEELAEQLRPSAGRATWPDGRYELVDRRWIGFDQVARLLARRIVRGEIATAPWDVEPASDEADAQR